MFCYAPNSPAMGRCVAVFVDKILKDAKPGDLPIEQPTKFELAIHLETANALGLTIPRSLYSARTGELVYVATQAQRAGS